jgi:hypothetical protein
MEATVSRRPLQSPLLTFAGRVAITFSAVRLVLVLAETVHLQKLSWLACWFARRVKAMRQLLQRPSWFFADLPFLYPFPLDTLKSLVCNTEFIK